MLLENPEGVAQVFEEKLVVLTADFDSLLA
jgi:hypothetical protein